MILNTNCTITTNEILTLVLSGLGFVTGCVALFISWSTYKRDNYKIVLRVYRNQVFLGSGDDTKYTILDIYNDGRRPAIITKAGYQFLMKDAWAIFSDFKNLQGTLTIKEKKYYSFKLNQSKVNLEDISNFIVMDTSGKSYKYYITNRFIVYFFDFLHKVNIYKKERL